VFTHIPGENNPMDILSKHWGHMLKALLFISGEMVNAPGQSDKEVETTSSVCMRKYRVAKCTMTTGRQGPQIVHRHQGVTKFWKGNMGTYAILLVVGTYAISLHESFCGEHPACYYWYETNNKAYLVDYT
jgi:hypothetical protein